MITIGPLTLKPHRLVSTMYAEMTEALEAMEAGNYDGAYRLLEAVTRPKGGLSADDDMPEHIRNDLVATRMYREIVKSAPPGLYQPVHSASISVLAFMLAKISRAPELLESRDELVVLLMCATSCCLDFDFELTE